MSLRRVVAILGLLFYILLWAIALHGATSLIAPLVVPLVLAVLVAAGVALERFLGIPPRRQRFEDPKDDTTR